MNTILPVKTLLMAVIEKDNAVLMRKKPVGSFPYEDTWYIFGCEKSDTKDDIESLKDYILNTLGITASHFEEVGSGDEIKEDHDGITKHFFYVNFRCEYQTGELKAVEGIERIEWVPKDKLSEHDIVPPSVKLFKELGYL
ncbi:hypothetical protein K2Q02_01940 [Patescibacteria group bacterium]|nr:hypothetical protein [Patescibacteria group bacterium]